MVNIVVLTFVLSIPAIIVAWYLIVSAWKRKLKSDYHIKYPIVSIIVATPIIFTIISYIIVFIAFSGVSDWKQKKYFKPNFIDSLPNVAYENVAFLEEIKAKLGDYCFNGGAALSFEKEPKAVSFLRNHYLHWNSTYGEEGIEVGVQTNHPNKVDGKRQRKVR